jgi:hypothetical protein
MVLRLLRFNYLKSLIASFKTRLCNSGLSFEMSMKLEGIQMFRLLTQLQCTQATTMFSFIVLPPKAVGTMCSIIILTPVALQYWQTLPSRSYMTLRHPLSSTKGRLYFLPIIEFISDVIAFMLQLNKADAVSRSSLFFDNWYLSKCSFTKVRLSSILRCAITKIISKYIIQKLNKVFVFNIYNLYLPK